MFSGIVEEVGTVRRLDRRSGRAVLIVGARRVLDDVRVGDSIAINGACLTVTAFDTNQFTVEMTPETLRRTNLGDLEVGGRVNLERSLPANARIGGHFVQGHVDGVGQVESIRPEGDATIATFSAPAHVQRYIVPKGYVAVDGMSLTVVDRLSDGFTISFIPHTLEVTVAQDYALGTRVNLEADIVGKYVERFLHPNTEERGTAGITRERLRQYGFVSDGE